MINLTIKYLTPKHSVSVPLGKNAPSVNLIYFFLIAYFLDS